LFEAGFDYIEYQEIVMKICIGAFLLALGLSFSVMGQMDKMDSATPTEKDKTEAIPSNTYLKRGAPIATSDKVSLNAVLKSPAKYSGKTLLIEGIVVRSCKMEGCWAEVAENKDSKSVRITMKDHAFFIPLQSAGSLARVEGKVSLKTLTKEQVEHLVKEDGAKFDNVNMDGTVTEVSFEATGIELKKAT
jgi:Domain of unknown function (DUF4920)